jgi:hypothetical protein
MSKEPSATQWFKVTLPAAECGTGGKALQNDFETLFTINGAPKDAALFGSKDVEHCFFYFSPAAVKIAGGLIQHFGGLPSPPPFEDERTPLLLVGQADALELLLKDAETPKARPKRIIDHILRRS